MSIPTHRRQLAAILATLVMCASVLFYTYGHGLSAKSVPAELNDREFWRLVDDFSEPNGYFRSDNLLSNENTFQHVIPTLQTSLPAEGVYLGVGPEQNFTYIAALRPKLAFIVDIRRGNMNLQLLYKAFMELSPDRADFLSRLFARPRPANLNDKTPVDELLDAYELASPSDELYQHNLQEASDHLTKVHKFGLTPDDLRGLDYVYSAFFKAGPDLNYSFSGGPFGGGFRFPTYATLMTETDGRGEHRSYLATEANYRIVRGDGGPQRHRSDHRRLRRPQGAAFGGPVSEGSRRDGHGHLHVERRAVSVSERHELAALLRERGDAPHHPEDHVHSFRVESRLRRSGLRSTRANAAVFGG